MDCHKHAYKASVLFLALTLKPYNLKYVHNKDLIINLLVNRTQ